jgi:hypothetical protein
LGLTGIVSANLSENNRGNAGMTRFVTEVTGISVLLNPNDLRKWAKELIPIIVKVDSEYSRYRSCSHRDRKLMHYSDIKIELTRMFRVNTLMLIQHDFLEWPSQCQFTRRH